MTECEDSYCGNIIIKVSVVWLTNTQYYLFNVVFYLNYTKL